MGCSWRKKPDKHRIKIKRYASWTHHHRRAGTTIAFKLAGKEVSERCQFHGHVGSGHARCYARCEQTGRHSRSATPCRHSNSRRHKQHITLLDGVPVRDPVSLGRYLGAFSPLALNRMTVYQGRLWCTTRESSYWYYCIGSGPCSGQAIQCVSYA